MKYKLRIKILRNIKWINKFFKKMREDGEWGYIRCKTYKGVYKSKSKSLYNMLRLRRKDAEVVKNTNSEYIVDVKGSKDYVENQKQMLEEWLDNDKDEVKDKAEVMDFENNRQLNSVWKKMKWKFQKKKNEWGLEKINQVLGDETVRDFFTRAGIRFKYNISEVQEDE